MDEQQGSSALESRPTQNAMQQALAKALEATKEPVAPAPKVDTKPDEGTDPIEAEADEEQPQLEAETERTEDESEEVSSETETAEASTLEAPGQWTKEAREIFSTLDPEVQEIILAETKRGERLITRKSQELSETAKRWEKLQEVMNPYRNEFTSGGLDEVGAVQNLLRIHDALKTNPTQAVEWLAQTYGAELPTAQTDDDQDEYASPSESAMRKEIQRLQQQVASLQSTQQQAHATTVEQMVQNFRTAKTPGGELLHPFAGELEGHMARLIQSGLATDLESAYAQALRLRPELLEQQQAEAETKRKSAEALKRAKAAAEARKKARASGASGGTSAAQRGRMSLQDSLNAARQKLG